MTCSFYLLKIDMQNCNLLVKDKIIKYFKAEDL